MSCLLGDETEMSALCTVALFDLKKKKKESMSHFLRLKFLFVFGFTVLLFWFFFPLDGSDSVACDVGINHHRAGTPRLTPFPMECREGGSGAAK